MTKMAKSVDFHEICRKGGPKVVHFRDFQSKWPKWQKEGIPALSAGQGQEKCQF